MTATTHYRTCPFCEATCGLAIETDDGEVTRVRGDADDVFSHGYLCPKGIAIGEFHADPDRLRQPLVRRGSRLEPASWEEAFAVVEAGYREVTEAHGRQSVGIYLGNPNVHNLAGLLYAPVLAKALGTRFVFTATTVDQMPKYVTCGLMFGEKTSIPVPDVDRTDYMLVLGADPLTSNGSLFTAPDMPGRLRALRRRGGKLVVVDPRRSRTAEEADRHVFIRPGMDALLLAAMATVLFEEDLVQPGRLAAHVEGVEDVRSALSPFTPESVAAACGVPAEDIRALARELAAAPRAAVYGRIGTCTVRFGTLATWLVDVLNVLTGNLDREGGAMFTLAAAGQRTLGGPKAGRPIEFGRWTSRVRGLPEVFSELPAACLAEEIDTPAGPGETSIRGLFTVAGNPALSSPDGGRLDRALDGLEFMVSIDCYLNETTRHADVVLPPPSPLERPHYDLAFGLLSVRNIANWSTAIFDKDPSQPEEWEILLRLAAIASGQGADADLVGADAFVATTLIQREAADPDSPIAGRDPAEVLAELAPHQGPERLLDFLLRIGPYGEWRSHQQALSLDTVAAAPHGIDLGPLMPRIPEILRTPSGKVELAPTRILADLPRLEDALDEATNGLVLVGRRQLRSNNSWMHNLPLLVGGTNRCTLLIHPEDAEARGLDDGQAALVRSRAGEVEVEVEVTDSMMRGVVSLPHGWGHGRDGTAMDVAADHAGVNTNVLTDPLMIDPLSGNAVLNGIPVDVEAVGLVSEPAEAVAAAP